MAYKYYATRKDGATVAYDEKTKQVRITSAEDGKVYYYNDIRVADAAEGTIGKGVLSKPARTETPKEIVKKTRDGDTYYYQGGKLVRLVDERGNTREYNADGSTKSLKGPSGTERISGSKADTERLTEEQRWDDRESEWREYMDGIQKKNDELLAPMVALRDSALLDLAKYRKDPGAYTREHFGADYDKGVIQGTDAIERAASARGDFLGDATKKRIGRHEIDYLSTKKNEALGEIMMMLGLGGNAVTQQIGGANQTAGMNQNYSLAAGAAGNGQSAAVHNSIAQAAQMRNMEMMQRSQQIADRQTAMINMGGNVAASIPGLFAPPPGAA